MEKPLFNADNYGEDVCMQFENEDEYDAFSEYLDSIGKKWCDDQRYIEYSAFHRHDRDTVLYFNHGRYGTANFVSGDTTILHYSDFRYEVGGVEPPEPEIFLTFDDLAGF